MLERRNVLGARLSLWFVASRRSEAWGMQRADVTSVLGSAEWGSGTAEAGAAERMRM
jgi:hypothetical protein